MKRSVTKVIAFDLGDTLVEYEGLPLSWEAHYDQALQRLAAYLGVEATAHHLALGSEVLRRSNTRIHPREGEVAFASIMRDLANAFGVETPESELSCARVFFDAFRQRLRCFPETLESLQKLRERGLLLGVFTDVPYGMPRELVIEDMKQASIHTQFDAILTSRDTGFRKPVPATLQSLAEALSCEPCEMLYVGNEKKDVEVARACGCGAVLIDRERRGNDWGQDRTIQSLLQI
ncbi:MAG: HAD family hydrolase [Opitutaceae bacterium]|nr:HAD family hydrolase [Opitutaceae bacterium]